MDIGLDIGLHRILDSLRYGIRLHWVWHVIGQWMEMDAGLHWILHWAGYQIGFIVRLDIELHWQLDWILDWI